MKLQRTKIQAFLLAIVILLASNSYAITSHFCGEELVATSIIGKNLSCGMEATGDDCDTLPKVKKDCCINVVTFLESQNFVVTKDFAIGEQQIVPVVIFIKSYLSLFENPTLSKKEFYKNFSPPNIEKDIRVLHQTFII